MSLEQALVGGLLNRGGDDDGEAAAASAAAEIEADQKLRAEQEAEYDRIFNGAPAEAAESEKVEEPGEAAAEEAVAEAPAEPEKPAESAGAPEHWSQADKDKFAALPDSHKQWFLDVRKGIERNADTKYQEAGEIRRSYEAVDQALAPLDATLKEHGISKGDAVGRLVRAHQALVADPSSGLAVIAEQYVPKHLHGSDQARDIVRKVAAGLGVNIGGGLPAATADQAQQRGAVDPAQVAEQVALQVERRIVFRGAQSKLEAFTGATDGAGQLKHPHYAQVKHVMAAMLGEAAEAGRPMSLEDAYAQAVYTRPELREAMIKADRDAAAKAADEARRSKVANARNAGTPQTRSAPAAREDPHAGKSLREAQEAEYDRIFGAAH
ncbi:MAG: hypothetical protein AB7O44_27360 [Hyphomicrobiaceae bacterium]|uniref:hypothetical protein n=1 Tax=Hyphomicrobium sp. TaxID=82 RepID=UPI003D1198D4